MNPEVPFNIEILFIILVIGLFAFFITRARKLVPDLTQKIGISLALWLGVLAAFSQTDFIRNFNMIPPPLLFVLLPPIIVVLIIAFHKNTGSVISLLNPVIPVMIQAFRIVMEFILWALYKNDIIPVQMTFEGRNFDIFIGLTAIPVAYLLLKGQISKRVVILWNVTGILVLTNIVVVAILSAPTPFRYFMNEPANTIITYFPFVWLPGFVVPFAYLSHVLSIKQMLHNEPS